MGLFELLRHLPRLLRLRGALRAAIARRRAPMCSSASTAPEFNLGLARRAASARGMRTVQYVSPQVWAWRQGRVRTIGAACDLVLCLLPFETEFYAQPRRAGASSSAIRSPIRFRCSVDRAAARARWASRAEPPIVALLPGSRVGEVQRLGEDFPRARRAGCARARPRPAASSRRWPRRPSVRSSQRSACERPAAPAVQLARRPGAARRWPPPMSCWWPPAPRRSRRCCPAARWWSPTGSARLTAFAAATLGLVKVPVLLAAEPAGRPRAGAGVPSGAGDAARPWAKRCCASWSDPAHVRELLERISTESTEQLRGGGPPSAGCAQAVMRAAQRGGDAAALTVAP